LSDTMRIELAGSGVKVSVIEPGPIRSRLQEHAVAHFKRNIDLENSVHREQYKHLLAKSEILDSKLWGYERPGEGSTWSFLPRYRLGPDAVLAKLVHAIESRNPKPHYHVTAATHVVALARRVLPARAMDLLARSVS
jgi:NAD(P)-dependent dehydrogenase (short-subunit alcohol dehydrogenase family)